MESSKVMPASELFVIKMDPQTNEVFVGSKSPDIGIKLAQVSSEDARAVAVQAYRAAGNPNAAMRSFAVNYGDDEAGEAAKEINPSVKMNPFLVVRFASGRSEAAFVGDSHVQR